MNKQHLEVALARYAVVTLVISSIVLTIASVSDVMGTWGFANTLVPPGNPWVVIITTAILFAITTAIQLQAGGMAFDSGTIMYVAGVGALLKLFGATSSSKVGIVRTTIGSFEMVENRWGGAAWIMLFVWPSLLFDGITDFIYLSGTAFSKLAPLGFLSSFVTEQFLMLSSVSITMIRKGYPPKASSAPAKAGSAPDMSFGGGSRERAR